MDELAEMEVCPVEAGWSEVGLEVYFHAAGLHGLVPLAACSLAYQ